MIMARASASKTSDKIDCIRPIRDPSLRPPVRFERLPKPAGSKVLMFGEWVRAEDEAAVLARGPQ